MTMGLVFWILMLNWLIYGVWGHWSPTPYWVHGTPASVCSVLAVGLACVRGSIRPSYSPSCGTAARERIGESVFRSSVLSAKVLWSCHSSSVAEAHT
jgi:hypothetical protein